MPDETDKKVEAVAEQKSTKASDSVVKEVDGGRSDLVDKAKEHLDYLKGGGKSGITDEFGKPIYLISEGDAANLVDKGSALADKVASAFGEIKGAIAGGNAASVLEQSSGNLEKVADIGKGVTPADFADAQVHKDVQTPAEPSQAGDKGIAAPAQPSDAKTAAPVHPGDSKGASSAQQGGAYGGEDIHRDIEPGWHTAKKGESITKIAKDHLGPDASPEEVKKYATEIAKRNGLDPAKPGNIEGKELALPGNTKDGGYIYSA